MAGEGEYEEFPSKFFCFTVPKNFVGESFTAAVISGAGKVWVRRGEYQDFPWKFFCLSAEKFRRGTLQCFTNFGYRKILCFRGLCHDNRISVEIFFVSQCRNLSQVNPSVLCFRNLPVAKKFR